MFSIIMLQLFSPCEVDSCDANLHTPLLEALMRSDEAALVSFDSQVMPGLHIVFMNLGIWVDLILSHLAPSPSDYFV